MTQKAAIQAPVIFDGSTWHSQAALVHQSGTVLGVSPVLQLPEDVALTRLESGFLAPGFVDLQVNGGGGVLLNDEPSVDSIRTICTAHGRFGTTALLPTLITDTPEITERAIAAAKNAADQEVAGFLGLHLEGPHLSVERRGAHDAGLVRPAGADDMTRLLDAQRHIPHLLVTVAPEAVTVDQIRLLSEAGVTVSLGHSNADCTTAREMIRAGASLFTHLFNAMSPLGHREPGMVGAALSEPSVHAGLIADGIHVDPASLGIAIRGKAGPGRLFVVTDAMSCIGTDQRSFTLNGRTVHRADGRLTLDDDTLAGADIDMIASVRLLVEKVGLQIDEALKMASLYPARALGAHERHGHLGKGAAANIVHLSDALHVENVWIAGERVFGSG